MSRQFWRPAGLLLLAVGSAAAGGRPLGQAEVNQLARLQQGKVGKDELEVVLAQFDEDLEWSKPFEKVRTVYCKGSAAQCPEGSVKLPNVGREGHTFLHHIVSNYDRLSAWTVFSQAGAPGVASPLYQRSFAPGSGACARSRRRHLRSLARSTPSTHYWATLPLLV